MIKVSSNLIRDFGFKFSIKNVIVLNLLIERVFSLKYVLYPIQVIKLYNYAQNFQFTPKN
jgi:hypothetical protein